VTFLGHPVHPALVHFPIALLVLVPLGDVAALLTGWPALWAGAFYCLLAGLVTGLVASVPGFVDYLGLPRDAAVERTALRHLGLVLVALALAAVGAIVRGGHGPLDGARAGATLGLSLATLIPLLAGSYFGGSLVFRHGVGVRKGRNDGTAT
jgi:uncharacterized membrane protein